MKDYAMILIVGIVIVGLGPMIYAFISGSIVLGIIGLVLYTLGVFVLGMMKDEPDLKYNEFDERGLYL